MLFVRNDDIDSFGNQRVNYILSDSPGNDFTVSITKTGVQISGTTPNFSDFIEINRIMVWSKYQFQAFNERRGPIPQSIIDSGGVW